MTPLLLSLALLTSTPAEVAQQTKPLDIVLIIDRSGSMAPIMEATKEAAKLIIALLGRRARVTIVLFSDRATASPAFTDPAAAMRWLDPEMHASGGTSYEAAFRAVDLSSKDRITILLSDGRPGESIGEIRQYLQQHVHSPMHTVCLEDEASAVLSEIASLTGGGAYQVRGPEQMVRALLAIVQDIRRYRIFSPQELAVPKLFNLYTNPQERVDESLHTGLTHAWVLDAMFKSLAPLPTAK